MKWKQVAKGLHVCGELEVRRFSPMFFILGYYRWRVYQNDKGIGRPTRTLAEAKLEAEKIAKLNEVKRES